MVDARPFVAGATHRTSFTIVEPWGVQRYRGCAVGDLVDHVATWGVWGVVFLADLVTAAAVPVFIESNPSR